MSELGHRTTLAPIDQDRLEVEMSAAHQVIKRLRSDIMQLVDICRDKDRRIAELEEILRLLRININDVVPVERQEQS